MCEQRCEGAWRSLDRRWRRDWSLGGCSWGGMSWHRGGCSLWRCPWQGEACSCKSGMLCRGGQDHGSDLRRRHSCRWPVDGDPLAVQRPVSENKGLPLNLRWQHDCPDAVHALCEGLCLQLLLVGICVEVLDSSRKTPEAVGPAFSGLGVKSVAKLAHADDRSAYRVHPASARSPARMQINQ